MRRFVLSLVVVATGLLYVQPALAQSGGGLQAQGPYIGGAAGGGWLKSEDGSFDEVGVAWKVLSGFRSKFFAIEADYRNMGSITGALEGLKSTTKGFQTSALLMLPVGPLDLYGRGGAFFWKNKVAVGDVSEEIDGTAFGYGGGLAVRIGGFSLRAEYEVAQIEELNNPWIATGGITIAF